MADLTLARYLKAFYFKTWSVLCSHIIEKKPTKDMTEVAMPMRLFGIILVILLCGTMLVHSKPVAGEESHSSNCPGNYNYTWELTRNKLLVYLPQEIAYQEIHYINCTYNGLIADCPIVGPTDYFSKPLAGRNAFKLMLNESLIGDLGWCIIIFLDQERSTCIGVYLTNSSIVPIQVEVTSTSVEVTSTAVPSNLGPTMASKTVAAIVGAVALFVVLVLVVVAVVVVAVYYMKWKRNRSGHGDISNLNHVEEDLANTVAQHVEEDTVADTVAQHDQKEKVNLRTPPTYSVARGVIDQGAPSFCQSSNISSFKQVDEQDEGTSGGHKIDSNRAPDNPFFCGSRKGDNFTRSPSVTKLSFLVSSDDTPDKVCPPLMSSLL